MEDKELKTYNRYILKSIFKVHIDSVIIIIQLVFILHSSLIHWFDGGGGRVFEVPVLK